MPEKLTTPATEAPAADAANAAPEAAAAAPAAADTEDGTKTLEQLAAELATWKGHARTWEDRAKENKTAAEKLAEIEKAKLTETERLQAELAELTAERDRNAAELLRTSVAAAKGVPANLLTGSTKEELEAAADALLAFRRTPRPPANDAAASGAQGSPISTGKQLTREDLKGMSAAEKRAARAEGRLNTLLGIK